MKTESNPGLAPHGGHQEKIGRMGKEDFLYKELSLPRVRKDIGTLGREYEMWSSESEWWWGGEPVDMHAYRSVCVHGSEIPNNSRTRIVGR